MKKIALFALGMLVFVGVNKEEVIGMNKERVQVKYVLQQCQKSNWDAIKDFLGRVKKGSDTSNIKLFGTIALAAAASGQVEVLKQLVDLGVNLYQWVDGDGNCVLHKAIQNGQKKACNYLTSKSLSNKRLILNKNGKTPFDLAKKKNMNSLVQEMEKRNAFSKEALDHSQCIEALPLYPSEEDDNFDSLGEQISDFVEVEAKPLISNEDEENSLDDSRATENSNKKKDSSRKATKQHVSSNSRKNNLSESEKELLSFVGDSKWASARRAYNNMKKRHEIISRNATLRILKFLAEQDQTNAFSQWYSMFEKDGALDSAMLAGLVESASQPVRYFITANKLVEKLESKEKEAKKKDLQKKRLLSDEREDDYDDQDDIEDEE